MEAGWMQALRTECKRSSQVKVAAMIGYSGAVVNQVLKGLYKGDLVAVEKAVRGALMGDTVACPVLEEIPSNRCLEEQRRPFAATNAQRLALYRACRSGCPHSRLEPQ